jgi:hypothetical protein
MQQPNENGPAYIERSVTSSTTEQPAGARSGEGSDSILEHLRRDTNAKEAVTRDEVGGVRRPRLP